MNLYKFHSKPENLDHYESANEKVPHLFVKLQAGLDTEYIFKKALTTKQVGAIAKVPDMAAQYALYVRRGRWPEAEKYIMKDPQSACFYAIELLRERWVEAEPFILKDENCWWEYKMEFGI